VAGFTGPRFPTATGAASCPQLPHPYTSSGWGGAPLENLAREIQTRPREQIPSRDLGLSLYGAGLVILRGGDRSGAEVLVRELEQLGERTRDPSLAVMAQMFAVDLAFLDGRIEESISSAESVTVQARDRGIVAMGGDVSRMLFYLGRGNAKLLEQWSGPSRPDQANTATILAFLGRHEEAQALRARFGDVESEADESGASILMQLFEAAILGADADTARGLSHRFAPMASHLAYSMSFPVTVSIARLLGQAAALLGRLDEARAYYQQAIGVCARVRFRPEMALTRFHFAELLLEHYPEEHAEAQAHLDFAIEEFRAMNMQPYLERALRHKGLLHA